MTRDVRLCAAIAVGFAFSLAPLPASATSITEDAKKVCIERYNLEKDGGSLPKGMAKSKYMSQCTKGYVRTAQLEASLAQQGTSANSQAGTSGNSLAAQPEPLKPQTVRLGH